MLAAPSAIGSSRAYGRLDRPGGGAVRGLPQRHINQHGTCTGPWSEAPQDEPELIKAGQVLAVPNEPDRMTVTNPGSTFRSAQNGPMRPCGRCSTSHEYPAAEGQETAHDDRCTDEQEGMSGFECGGPIGDRRRLCPSCGAPRAAAASSQVANDAELHTYYGERCQRGWQLAVREGPSMMLEHLRVRRRSGCTPVGGVP